VAEDLDPFVRVVVLNWNSAWFTRRCIESLAGTDYPADRHEVVLVDNGSVDGSLERLRDWFPALRVVENGRNLGFAEGCNRAMRDRRGVDAVALINNDTVVDPGWLRALVDALGADERIGAASARLVLEPGFRGLDVSAQGTVALRRVATDGSDVTGAVRVDGFTPVSDAAWPLDQTWCISGSTGRLWVPSAEGISRISIELDGHGPVSIEHDGRRIDSPAPGAFEVVSSGAGVRLLNGLGSARNARSEGYDRHYGETFGSTPEESMEIVDVDGFCGGAALLRSSMLDEVGIFDPRLFAYYEDTDLSWRATRAGWRVVAVPGSVVEHAFGASGGTRASGFFHLDRRNWWLTAERNGTDEQRRTVRAEVRREVRTALRSNVAGRIKRRQLPSLILLRAWARIVADHGLESRRRARRAHPTGGSRPIGSVATEDVVGRFQPPPVPRSPRRRPWGPLLVAVDVSAIVEPSPPPGWTPEAVSAGRSLVASLLQDHPGLDVIATVTDPRLGRRVAGPHEHRRILGQAPRRAAMHGTPDDPIPVASVGDVRLEIRSDPDSAYGVAVDLRGSDGSWLEVALGEPVAATGATGVADRATVAPDVDRVIDALRQAVG